MTFHWYLRLFFLDATADLLDQSRNKNYNQELTFFSYVSSELQFNFRLFEIFESSKLTKKDTYHIGIKCFKKEQNDQKTLSVLDYGYWTVSVLLCQNNSRFSWMLKQLDDGDSCFTLPKYVVTNASCAVNKRIKYWM